MLFKSVLTYLSLFVIGFANSLPLPLMGSTLSIWLAEEGFSKEAIGSFALLAIPFSLRVVWSPIVDVFCPPFCRKCHRKSWVVLSLWAIGAALIGLSLCSPSSLFLFSLLVLFLAIASGCLYIAGVAYELDALETSSSSVGSACVLTGYRVGLLCAGAGALYLSFFSGWQVAFCTMSCLIFLSSCIVLCAPEPFLASKTLEVRNAAFSQYSNRIRGLWRELFFRPCSNFFQRSDWKSILFLVLIFKLGDQLSHSMVGPFYLSLGFTKAEIATASKLWGMCAAIFGAFFAGIFFRKREILSSLCLVTFFHALSLLSLSCFSFFGNSMAWLSISVAFENGTAGMAMALFISFLWRILGREYSSVQYALLWSLFSLKGEILACLGSYVAAYLSWSSFFALSSCVSALAIGSFYVAQRSKLKLVSRT